MEIYELEDLFHIFSKHIEQSEKQREQNVKSYQENNPGEKLPDHMKDEFNFPKAMATICSEILKLKKAN